MLTVIPHALEKRRKRRKPSKRERDYKKKMALEEEKRERDEKRYGKFLKYGQSRGGGSTFSNTRGTGRGRGKRNQ
jgi:hypothetical protein